MPKNRQRRNPLPKAPPKRRLPGQPMPERQLTSSLERVRAMSAQLNERERGFDPSRAPTWRGSSRDLVVNPRPYEMRLVHKISPRDTDRKTASLPDSAFSSKAALAAALRKAGVLSSGQRLREFRVEGDKVVAFPESGIWHSIIIEMDTAGEYTTNPTRTTDPELHPGDCWYFNPSTPKDWLDSSARDWDHYSVDAQQARNAAHVGSKLIDGQDCEVFLIGDDLYVAQEHTTRTYVDPRDIPAHLHGAELRDEPDHNGQDVGYSQGMGGRSAEWFQVEYATGSDYSGGSVNESNYRVLAELLDEHHPEDAQPVVWARTSGGHGTYGIAVRYADLEDDVRKAIDALEDYPIMSDEDHSEIEIEQQDAAWEDWGRKDFIKALAKLLGFEDWDELEPLITEGQWFTVFNGAREAANLYWEDQQGAGQYIDVGDVADKAADILTSGKLPQHSNDYQDDAFEALIAALPEEEP